MKPLVQRALIALAAFLPIWTVESSALAGPPEKLSTPAWFEGRVIDLAVDWEGAGACLVTQAEATCFRTEKELNARLQLEAESAPSESAAALLAACGTPLRLYNGISYTGTVLSLNQRGMPLNLSAYGFDNATTSYKIGSCDTDFFSGPTQTGGVYPGNTAAFAQSPTMVTGWNNIISSVYIN